MHPRTWSCWRSLLLVHLSAEWQLCRRFLCSPRRLIGSFDVRREAIIWVNKQILVWTGPKQAVASHGTSSAFFCSMSSRTGPVWGLCSASCQTDYATCRTCCCQTQICVRKTLSIGVNPVYGNASARGCVFSWRNIRRARGISFCPFP